MQCDDEIEKDLDAKLREVKRMEWQLVSVFADRVCILCYTIVIVVVSIWVFSFASHQDNDALELLDHVRDIQWWNITRKYVVHNGKHVNDFKIEDLMAPLPKPFDNAYFTDPFQL